MKELLNLKIFLGSKDDLIVILPHILPDGDCLGSAKALSLLFEVLGYQSYIVLNDEIPKNLRYLYTSTKVFSSEEFRELCTSDKKIGLTISVDTSGMELFSDRSWIFANAENTMSIDHHKTNKHFAKNCYVDVNASSTAEIIYDYYVANDVIPSVEAATAILTGILTDTGCFKYSSTTEKTMKIASDLRKIVDNYEEIIATLFQSMSMGRVNALKQALETLEQHFDGQLKIVVLDEEAMNNLGIKDYETDGVIEFIRDIEDTEVAVFIRWLKNGKYKVSMRSKLLVDVSIISALNGGGGHKRAAGFSSEQSIEEIKNNIILESAKQLQP